MDSGSTWKDVTGEDSLASAPPGAGWIGALPTICAVHCLVTPLLASTLPFFAATHALEGWLLAVSAVLTVAALATSWRLHGRWAVLWMTVAGFAVWGLSVAGLLAPLPEAATSPMGGLLVAGALFWNGRLRHQAACGPCSCPVHGD